MNIFYLILEQPLINVLFLLYVFVPGHDFGIAVILLTVFIRLLLWPLAHKQLHSQRKLTAIQTDVKKLNEKYKGQPQEQQKALMELYREKEVNPGSSCLLSLVQMPILFALFYVFRDFGNGAYINIASGGGLIGDVYNFIRNLPAVQSFVLANPIVHTTFLGLVDLAKPSIPLALTAGVFQFMQTKMLTPKNQTKDMASALTSQMTLIMPVMITLFAFKLPSVLPFYWTLTAIFAIIQQRIVMKGEVEEMEEKVEEGKIVKKSKNKETLQLTQGGNKPRRKKHANKHRRH